MSKEKKKSDGKIHFTIDGKKVEAGEGWTVLETARHYGIHIPTLCYHEAVKPSGACRLCVVEAKQGDWSKIVISCMYPPWEGVDILTNSERVRNVRRWILEMLLAECPASKEVRKLAEESNQAAGNITNLVKGIEGEMQIALDAMEKSDAEVSNGAKTVGEAGEMLGEIVKGVKALNEKVQNISAASEEINASTGEIVDLMHTVAQGAEKNASAAGLA